MSKAMSLKARIRNIAKEKNIPAQVILQNYMFERDAITPHAVQYNFSEIFNDEKKYELWAYNIETVMAEKIETILRRGVFNTRPRDFYDAYIFIAARKVSVPILFRLRTTSQTVRSRS